MSGKTHKRLRKFVKRMGGDDSTLMRKAKAEYRKLRHSERERLNQQMDDYNMAD